MTFLRSVLVLLWLCQAAFALPEGEWLSDFYGQVGTIQLTDSAFAFALEEGSSASGFAGPLAEIRDPQGSVPGRLIVGPVEGGKFLYEVVWFYEPVGPRGRFFCELEGFQSLADAQASTAEFTMAEASLFFTKAYFQEVDAFPPLPTPDREGLVSLLEEALSRYKATPEEDVNILMETLMIDKGFHPKKSREPFEAAVQKFTDDATISRLLGELGAEEE